MKTTAIGHRGTPKSPESPDYPKQLYCVEWRTGTPQDWTWHRSPPLLPALSIVEFKKRVSSGSPARVRLWTFHLKDAPLPALYEIPSDFYSPTGEEVFTYEWPRDPVFEIAMPSLKRK